MDLVIIYAIKQSCYDPDEIDEALYYQGAALYFWKNNEDT